MVQLGANTANCLPPGPGVGHKLTHLAASIAIYLLPNNALEIPTVVTTTLITELGTPLEPFSHLLTL